MKKVAICLIGFFVCLSLQGQSLPDSILQAYSKVVKSSERGQVLAQSLRLREKPSQQTLSLLLHLHAYFKEKEDQVGLDYTSLFIATIFERFGNFSEALKLALPILPHFEQRQDTFGILRSHLTIGNSITNSENVEQALAYYKKALPTALKFNDVAATGTLLNNIADGYKRLGVLDSALLYAQDAVRITEKQGDFFSLATQMGTLGEIYLEKEDHEIGRTIIKKAISYARVSNNTHAIAYESNELARSFFRTLDFDSSIAYAKTALSSAVPDYKVAMMDAYQTLYKNYEQKGAKDSVFKYFRMSMTIKDSLFSIDKNRIIQVMNFQEQLRVQAQEEALKKEQEQRRHNLQYSAIVIGLVTFVLLLLMISRSIIVKEKFIRFFGVLCLLAVFEFINLFIHPYLDRLTNHSPVYMLFILMCIAALLIPLHHKIEHWAVKKLVEKNNKIRLAAAKKTIEQLEGKANQVSVEKSTSPQQGL
jgi:tetratricopeptide (TPR) repeat protein